MSTPLPDAAYVVALAGLPWASHRHLRTLLEGGTPPEVWARVRAGAAEATTALADVWRRHATGVDVDATWRAHGAAGVHVLLPGDAGFPPALRDDPEPPPVLFAMGSVDVVEPPVVAIVGTRRCTHYGRDVARELGHDLAVAGVQVASGLALGIDGAAHAGALLAAATPPVAVVGSGLDVIYPRRHVELWRRVAAAGVVLSEAPLGARPEAWRFPARNRLLAALAQVVVVVESHRAGGSMHTVEAAIARDRTVMAVPGPVRSGASQGTNGMLAEGAAPVRDATDVLVALGLSGSVRATVTDPRPAPDGDGVAVLEAVGWEPSTSEEVAARVATPLGPVTVHLNRLERDGWLVKRGAWWERVAVPR